MIRDTVPKIIYLDESLRENVLQKHSVIKDLVSDSISNETTVFVISHVPSPYVDESGKMHLGEHDFDKIIPYLYEFFSSYKRGMPVRESFEILIKRLTGE